jgi:hypothetical protein
MSGQRRTGTDDLWRWLIGGLLGGGAILGLLIAAYAIGYNRSHDGSTAAAHSGQVASTASPSFKDLAGGTSTLASQQKVTADDAYLARSISDPDAQIVKGYRAGLMASAIAGFDLAHKPDDIRALVAFIKSQKQGSQASQRRASTTPRTGSATSFTPSRAM